MPFYSAAACIGPTKVLFLVIDYPSASVLSKHKKPIIFQKDERFYDF